MKIGVAAVAAVWLVAGSSSEVSAVDDAQSHGDRAMRHDRYVSPHHSLKPRYPGASGWYPHDASQLQFGSTLWWDQMLRENRLNARGG
jgi:hypothetical protein